MVGSKVIRDADPNSPEPGSKFHHTVGFGPITLSDHTVSLEAEPAAPAETSRKGRPLGTASVTLEMTARDGGTEVFMTENPDGVCRPLGFLAPLQIGSLGRNAESLMRLEELALRKAGKR